MSSSALDVDAYLKRIGFIGTPRADEVTLRALHRLHLQNIPFESLDAQLLVRVGMDEETLFDKMIRRRRGGSCFELNLLFAALLRAIGFSVDILSGRIWHEDGTLSDDCGHMCLCVASGKWIADVGFIHLFQEPLALTADVEQHVCGRRFRLLQEGPLWFAEQWFKERWSREYVFTLHPKAVADFQERLDFYQASPESLFVKHRLCARERPDGLLLLWDFTLRTLVDQTGEWHQTELHSEAEFAEALRTHFGVELTQAFPTAMRAPGV